MDYIKEIIIMAAPIAAGFVTSILIPFLIKKIAVKKLENSIDEIKDLNEFKLIEKKLDYIIDFINELKRGRRK